MVQRKLAQVLIPVISVKRKPYAYCEIYTEE